MSRNEVQWRCRRSILELDIIMHTFFLKFYDLLDKSEKLYFHELLLLEDPELAEIVLYQKGDHPLIKKIIQSQRG